MIDMVDDTLQAGGLALIPDFTVNAATIWSRKPRKIPPLPRKAYLVREPRSIPLVMRTCFILQPNRAQLRYEYHSPRTALFPEETCLRTCTFPQGKRFTHAFLIRMIVRRESIPTNHKGELQMIQSPLSFACPLLLLYYSNAQTNVFFDVSVSSCACRSTV